MWMISKVNNLFECVLCCFLYALLGKKMPVKKKKKKIPFVVLFCLCGIIIFL